MRIVTRLYFNLVLFAFSVSAFATISTETSVQLYAIVSDKPPVITLHWINDPGATGYKIFKRTMGSNPGWGEAIGQTSGNGNSFKDTNVNAGLIYEYKVIKEDNTVGYGYLSSGIGIPEVTDKGILILVVEDSYINEADFKSALSQTISDIELDGWRVSIVYVSRDDSPVSVKQKIENIYKTDPQATRALYLLGRVPVPYSGNINPDGHDNHKGAWPADVYYADFSGSWTDNTVNNSSASDIRNRNIPGDGKFDQSYIPGKVVLQTGRIDFAKQFKFNLSEKEMLIAYLEKAHNYKMGKTIGRDKGLIDDNFTNKTDPFASSGYRNLSAFLGPDNVDPDADFIQAAKISGGQSYLWAYGCGGGSWEGCSGVANTDELVKNPVQTIFSLIFGSYFGDWDCDNNLMVATVVQGQTLATAWAGRPQWHLYHMGIGINIGYSAMLTQNNDTDYYPGPSTRNAKMVHIALLADPTLRMKYNPPPTNVNISRQEENIIVSWEQELKEGMFFNIYRKGPGEDKFLKLNNQAISENHFTDSTITGNGNYVYAVKNVVPQLTASGTYMNESLGTSKDITIDISSGRLENFEKKLKVYPNPSEGMFIIEGKGLDQNKWEIKVYTVDGTLINAMITRKAPGKYNLNITGYPKGIYILQLMDEEGNQKAIKIFNQ